jgi:translation initiation factor IF-3
MGSGWKRASTASCRRPDSSPPGTLTEAPSPGLRHSGSGRRVRCSQAGFRSLRGGRFLCPPPARSGGPPERGDAEIAAATEARINDRIRAREVLLIGENGEQLGVRPLPQALQTAREQDLDLVEVAPNANPPVCRIMDYRRYQYEQQQKRKESRKRATNVVIKEMKFRPKISGHDYETKMKNVERFLADGNKVKLTIMFRGREMAHPELGLKILNRIAEQVADSAIVEAAPRQDGRNMTMVLHPVKKQQPSSGRHKEHSAEHAQPAQPAQPAPTAQAAPAAPPAPESPAPADATGAR